MANFPEMLRFFRKRDGLTQLELAEKTGLTRSSINNYENGIREPDFETAELFADFFNVSIDLLIGRKWDGKDPDILVEIGINENVVQLCRRFVKLTKDQQEFVLDRLQEMKPLQIGQDAQEVIQ